MMVDLPDRHCPLSLEAYWSLKSRENLVAAGCEWWTRVKARESKFILLDNRKPSLVL